LKRKGKKQKMGIDKQKENERQTKRKR
jgi:hypothetical protein